MLKKIILHLVCLMILQSGYSQESVLKTKVTVNYQSTPVSEILTDISQKYAIDFYYNAAIPDLHKKVTINIKQATLEIVLNKLFENTTLIFRIEEGKVLLNTAKTQETVIHGYIIDTDSKETLIGATVLVKNTSIGTTTNTFGFYSLTLQAAPDSVLFSYIGYKDTIIEIKKSGDISLNISLSTQTMKMQEVVVTYDKSIVSNSQTGYTKLTMNEVKSLPAFMGERDIIKAIQLTPGVKSGNESSNGFYVRGGGPDQNLMLLDCATLYNTSHSFNLFSIFNPDAIKNVEINKSGFPARYGGRLSSVIDVKMKDGNMEKMQGEAALGYLTSKITIEGPIVKGKTSFIISCRRSFIDALLGITYNLKEAQDTVEKQSILFYDASVKVNHKFSDKDRVYASFYGSGDGFGFESEIKNQAFQYTSVDDVKIKWRNYNGAFRWNHLFSGKLFSNTTLTYSKFNLSIKLQSSLDYSNQLITDYLYSNTFGSTIEDYGIRTDFDYYPNPHHSIKYGGSAQTHKYQPGVSTYQLSDATSLIDTVFKNDYYSNNFFCYVEDDIELTSKIKANTGLHVSLLAAGNKIYPSLQPRLSLRYSLSSSQSMKASYSKMSQNIHLLTNSSLGLPFDLWVPATDKVSPMNAHHYSLGYSLEFHDRKYEFTAETYLKQMDNLIEYAEGANFTDTRIPWYDKIITGGKGKSYGLELFIRKKSRTLTGWVGYTLSRVHRSFNEIDNGKAFPYKFDKKHDLSIVAIYKLSDKVNFSGSWVFSTGNALTFAEGTYPAAQNFFYFSNNQSTGSIQYYTGHNTVRMPNYHRLDLGVNFVKVKKHAIRTWNISVYNAYARRNPFFIYATTDDYGNRKMRQVDLFYFVPSFTYSYKF
ncbi:MAG: TonB-dependent receptor [Bacteroidales bacterium]|nr:TonB-dependent receptor [Bacteroidales bacterium]MBN2818860.1 TonB-dependent receptor [Bacteroidales bacterium]